MEGFEKLESLYKREKYSWNFHQSSAFHMMTSVCEGCYPIESPRDLTEEAEKWKVEEPNTEFDVTLKGLGLQKKYQSSHKHTVILERMWEKRLSSDDLDYFKKRYFNASDLEKIISIADKLRENKSDAASECIIYLKKALAVENATFIQHNQPRFYSRENLSVTILEGFKQLYISLSQIVPVTPPFLFDFVNTSKEDKNEKPNRKP